MKKLLYLLLILILSFSLWACGSAECTEHVDADGNLLCDNCGTGVPCTAHVDANDDLACDKCSQPVPCTNHKDEDGNLACDKCGEALPCTSHKDSDKNLACDLCGVELECTHVDNNNDGICDVKACSWNYDHTHTYNPSWSHDKTSHWHAPTCSHTIEPKDKANHSDADNDGVCDVCSWDYDHTHTFDTENWETSETEHWHKATCGHNVTSDKAAHVDGNGICSVCQYVICTHEELDEENWRTNENGHWRPAKCGHEITEVEVIPHTYDDDGICTVCEYYNGHVHTYESGWTKDETYHWHASDCNHPLEIDGKEAHTEADENKDGVCDECEYTYCTHTYANKWSSDDSGHWYAVTCGCTGASAVKENHVDEIKDGVCDECGYEICEHTFNETKWASNATHHWHPATCGHDAKGFYEEHKDTDNDGICETCKDENGNPVQFCSHFSDVLSSDETGHWYAKICEHETAEQTKGFEIHTDAANDKDKDGICNHCGYQMCNHEGNINRDKYGYIIWENDGTPGENNGTHHWYTASCCPAAKIEYGEHTDVDVSFRCDRCEQIREDPNPVIPDIGDDDTIIITPPHYIGGKPKDE